jgi:hypothetical protein
LAVSIFPFTQISWRSKSIAKEWEPIKASIYGAVHYAEYEGVKQGYRKCDVYDFRPNSIMSRLKKVGADGLVFIPILISKDHGGYSHQHYNVDKFEDGTFIYGVVAKDPDDAILFHDSEVLDRTQQIKHNLPQRSHDNLGQLLGYPKCCRDFFSNTWLKDGCLDPMYETALNTSTVEKAGSGHVKVSGEPRLNRLIRYWGFNIIPFFPHSFECEEALKFSEWWIRLMRKKDRRATDACLEALNMPMTWSMKNGITYVEHPLFIGSSNGYYVPENRVVEWFPK